MAFVSTVYKPDPVRFLRSAVAGSALCGSPFFIREGALANLFCIVPGKTALDFSRDPLRPSQNGLLLPLSAQEFLIRNPNKTGMFVLGDSGEF